ncbi:MAG TPA: head GIN domain-containing protein [Draconibacterium sp.]|nr:head GIN domain-containing protein [Draconibacterium sp.]
MKTIQLFVVGLAIVITVSSCIEDFSIEGNGIHASEERIVSDFDRVNSSGDFTVHITNGPENDVIVSADENLLQFIETYVTNETLHIDVKGIKTLKNRQPMEVFIVTPTLEKIRLGGSGTITTDYFVTDKMDVLLSGSGRINAAFEAEEVDALLSGSGKIEFSGVADEADFVISGSGNIDAQQLDLYQCTTSTSGSGDTWVSVSQKLRTNISGSGNVFYSGNPQLETHISGSGNVISHN